MRVKFVFLTKFIAELPKTKFRLQCTAVAQRLLTPCGLCGGSGTFRGRCGHSCEVGNSRWGLFLLSTLGL